MTTLSLFDNAYFFARVAKSICDHPIKADVLQIVCSSLWSFTNKMVYVRHVNVFGSFMSHGGSL